MFIDQVYWLSLQRILSCLWYLYVFDLILLNFGINNLPPSLSPPLSLGVLGDIFQVVIRRLELLLLIFS